MQTRQIEAGTPTGAGGVSRRTALRSLGGGGLAALIATARVGSAGAQDATPESAAEGLPQVVQDWTAAWNSGDPAGNLPPLYAADGVYEDVPSGQSATGEGIAGYLTEILAGESDVAVEPVGGFGTDAFAILEYTFSATNQGIIEGAPVGTPFSVRVATLFELADGLIQRSADYYDVASIEADLGAAPAAATPAAATADADTDGDGALDSDEVAAGTDPATADADTDADGLIDGAETGLGTDPATADSDGDGVPDGAEVTAGTDPLDPADA